MAGLSRNMNPPEPASGSPAFLAGILAEFCTHQQAASHVPHKSLCKVAAAFHAGRPLASNQSACQSLIATIARYVRFCLQGTVSTLLQQFICIQLLYTHLTSSEAFSLSLSTMMLP
jgi:hypothetical protein